MLKLSPSLAESFAETMKRHGLLMAAGRDSERGKTVEALLMLANDLPANFDLCIDKVRSPQPAPASPARGQRRKAKATK